ncbi:MAG: D-alanyl-D-alanine carboxypeptidase family protein [Geminicoccaceae bacterium]
MHSRLILIIVVLVASLASAAGAGAFETAAKAAIIIDFRTGATLFEKNADERIPPASMSKLMTAYMVFDRLKSGRLKLDEKVLVSERAWKMGGSQMFLEVGERVKVEDLIRGVIVQSGNDACVTLAEALAGSEEEFARQMNEKAVELGLSGSSFANSTGLDAPGHLMTVRDLATVARRIIVEFPEYARYYAEREYEYAGIKQPNRNPLLQAGVPGVDGMKTGFTNGSGYGLVATAQRDDRRIIAVMAGLESAGQRRTEGERLLEYGFREFQEYRVFEPGAVVAQAGVWLGVEPTVPLTVAQVVALTLSQEARKGLTAKLSYASPVSAPVVQGQEIGRVEVSAPGISPIAVPLVAAGEVARAGGLGRATSALGYLIWGAPTS